MISCSIITSLMGCVVTAYLFFRYTWCIDLSLLQRSSLFTLMMLIGCVPLLVSYKLENLFGSFYPYYRYALYFIYIACIILFALTLFADAAAIVLSRININTQWAGKIARFWCFKVNMFLISAALLSACYALWAGLKTPAVKTVNLASDKIKAEQTIAVLSDLHIHRAISSQKIKNIVERTNAQKPDIILLAGDIIDDDVKHIADITALLKGLKAPKGIYFVTGNHEFYVGYRETVDELKKLGFTFLENNGVAVNSELYLAGIPDYFSARNYHTNIDLAKSFAASDPNQYRLLVSHTPADFGEKNNFDLEVSGHTHGGQIFPFHILTKLHNKYLAGHYKMNETSEIYVSRGAGQWGPQMRFLAPSEITIIKLKPSLKTLQKAPVDTVFAQGEANPYGKFFTGQTYLTRLSANDEIWNSSLANVTFEPGARTNWHKHSGGQILLVLAGEGRYQERDGEIRILHKGDVVRIPPEIEHWHGAAPNSWFTHISVETNLPNNQTTWLEPVTAEEYK